MSEFVPEHTDNDLPKCLILGTSEVLRMRGASSLRPRLACEPGRFSVWPNEHFFGIAACDGFFHRRFAAPVEFAHCMVLGRRLGRNTTIA